MKPPVSVAITCKNAGAGIAATIESVLPLSNDVVVYDTGSTDDTVQIAERYPVRIYKGEWQGYGTTRNTTLQKTRHDWVLTIDADETAEPGLITEIEQLLLDDANLVYAVRLRNFLSGKEFFWGDWRNDFRIRFFHKQAVRWNDAIIHEKPLLSAGTKVKRLKNHILHRNAASFVEYKKKLVGYAALTAQKYYTGGRTPTWAGTYLSPAARFARSYFFKAGFLDGRRGFCIALLFAQYTYWKYTKLKEFWKASAKH